MAKTIINIYKELVSLGHQIQIYKRKDGGYLIKSIGGKKFTGAKGNAYARQLLAIKGTGISKAKEEQLKSITSLRSQSKEFKQLYKETRDIWKEALKKGELKVKGGTPKPQSIMKYLSKYGEELAKEALIKKQQYAKGIAYSENVDLFKSKLERVLMQYTTNFDFEAKNNIVNGLMKIIKFLEENKEEIKETTLSNLINIWYIVDTIFNEASLLSAIKSSYTELQLLPDAPEQPQQPM